jgi:hypothetical protein
MHFFSSYKSKETLISLLKSSLLISLLVSWSLSTIGVGYRITLVKEWELAIYNWAVT